MTKLCQLWAASAILLGAWLLPSSLSASVQISGRHVYILYPGLDSVWGSYLFMVNNNGSQAERFNFKVMLPAEVIDFQGQDSLGPEDLKLGPDGGLTIDKLFDPGDSLLNIGFKLPGKVGEAPISILATSQFATLGIFVFEGKFTISGPQLEIRKNVDFSGRNYDTYTTLNGELGKTYRFTIEGIPEGRGRLWLIGWIFAAILAGMALTFAWLSRPQITRGSEDAI